MTKKKEKKRKEKKPADFPLSVGSDVGCPEGMMKLKEGAGGEEEDEEEEEEEERKKGEEENFKIFSSFLLSGTTP